MTGGWKQKSGWIQIPPASCVPSLFPFYLNYLSVSLPRVCAPTLPLTNTELTIASQTIMYSNKNI